MSSSKTLVREIHPEVKVLDAAQGLVKYLASDQTLDHYREVILAKGWRFNYFKKNAPFVDSHDYSRIERLLGRVESYEVQGDKLVEVVKWAIDTDHPLAKLGFDLTEKGYLKAVSVGFIPSKAVCRGDEEFGAACKEAGLSTEQAGNCRAIYKQHEQIELSACIIGANPNALAKAYDARDINEEAMHLLGLDSDEALAFLHHAAAEWERPECTPVMRSMIRLNLRRCYNFSSASGSPADTRRGASDPKPDAKAEEESRDAFLAQLKSLTAKLG